MPEEEKKEEVKELRKLVRYFVEREKTSEIADPVELGLTLKDQYRSLKEEHAFQPGDLVQWKKGLRNRRKPIYKEPSIVFEVLAEPKYSEEKDATAAAFWEPLDLVLGVLDEDKDMIIYHFDKRRFEPFPREPW